MTEQRIPIKQKNFKNKFGLKRDYRATVGTLKEALEGLDDDLPIGVLYDTEFAYCNINEVLIGKDGLIRLIGD